MLDHGGSLRRAAIRYQIALGDWLDLSTGINPNGWPVTVVPDSAWQRLPEPEDGLETAASAYYGTAHLLPVAGSQAAIQLLPTLRRHQCRVGVLHPSYAEHAYAWQRAGHNVEKFFACELDAALDRLNVLIVVNPNNPTGTRFSSSILLDWHRRLAKRGGWLIVDEAFVDATPNASLAVHVGQPGLIILRSLGKFYGLAGIRIGFILAESEILGQALEQLGPWTISGPSRAVAIEALADRYWQEHTRLALLHSSKRLADMLNMQGLTTTGTALFRWSPLADSEFWQDSLARRGILVRCFTDPPGLRFGLPGSELAWQRLELALVSINAEKHHLRSKL